MILYFFVRYMKKVFSLIGIIFVFVFLSGCGGPSIKDWPASTGDIVHVDYVATFERFPQVLYDTTQEKVVQDLKADIAKKSFWPLALVAGEDTDKQIPLVVQEALVGMKAGDQKTIVVSPADGFGYMYDATKEKEISGDPLLRAWIQLKIGQVQGIDGKKMVVKAIKGQADNQTIVFDANALETYNTLVYVVTVHQVGGKTVVTQ